MSKEVIKENNNDDDAPVCWICHGDEDTEETPLFRAGCQCTGGYCHTFCIFKFAIVRGPINFQKNQYNAWETCPVCKSYYDNPDLRLTLALQRRDYYLRRPGRDCKELKWKALAMEELEMAYCMKGNYQQALVAQSHVVHFRRRRLAAAYRKGTPKHVTHSKAQLSRGLIRLSLLFEKVGSMMEAVNTALEAEQHAKGVLHDRFCIVRASSRAGQVLVKAKHYKAAIPRLRFAMKPIMEQIIKFPVSDNIHLLMRATGSLAQAFFCTANFQKLHNMLDHVQVLLEQTCGQDHELMHKHQRLRRYFEQLLAEPQEGQERQLKEAIGHATLMGLEGEPFCKDAANGKSVSVIHFGLGAMLFNSNEYTVQYENSWVDWVPPKHLLLDAGTKVVVVNDDNHAGVVDSFDEESGCFIVKMEKGDEQSVLPIDCHVVVEL